MKRLIEITLILLLIAFVVGCKEKEPYYTRPWGEVLREQMDKADALQEGDEPEPNEPVIVETMEITSDIITVTGGWFCSVCGRDFGSEAEALAHYCIHPELRELALGIVREAILGFLEQGYTFDPNAAE